MRELAQSIYDLLETKFLNGSKVYNTNRNGLVGQRISYWFSPNNMLCNTYRANYQSYQSGGSSFYVEKNGIVIMNVKELLEIYDLATKIFVPTDPDLKRAMAQMSMNAMAKRIIKESTYGFGLSEGDVTE